VKATIHILLTVGPFLAWIPLYFAGRRYRRVRGKFQKQVSSKLVKVVREWIYAA
jgi:hypothetical protein